MSQPPIPVQPSQASLEGTFRDGAYEVSTDWLASDPRFVFCQSILWDGLAEYLRFGVLQRFPEYALSEMLPALGADRKIFRGLSESDENYAARLRQFKATWKLAGNAPTLLRQLFELMRPNCPRIRYVVNGYDESGVQFADWWTIDDDGLAFERVSPSNWNWDGRTGKNIRFWIILYRTDLVPAKWGIPPYSWGESGLIWAGAPGSNVRDWVRDAYAIVQTFRAAGSALGPWEGFGGGLIVANPTFTSAPWGAGGPFDPSLPAGYPMPNGLWQNPAERTPEGAVYLSGLG